MKILLVEDDKELANEIHRTFSNFGIEIGIVTSRENLSKKDFSLLILDLALLNSKGIEACREAKKRGIPIIVLSSDCDVNTKVKWLKAGADDFLVKPFSTRELLARCLAIMRRYKNKNNSVLEFEGIVLKKKEGRLIVNGKSINLTKIEMEILELLMKHKEEVLSKEFLIHRIWKKRKSSRTLDVYIHRLRKKLGEKGKHLKTLTNVGYILTRNV